MTKERMQLREKQQNFISILKSAEVVKLPVNDIIYIESNGRKIYVKTCEETHCVYEKLTEAEKLLDFRFYKCHSRCIINLDKVVKMRKQEIIFEGGEQIYISKQKFTDTIRFYKGYLIKKQATMLG